MQARQTGEARGQYEFRPDCKMRCAPEQQVREVLARLTNAGSFHKVASARNGQRAVEQKLGGASYNDDKARFRAALIAGNGTGQKRCAIHSSS